MSILVKNREDKNNTVYVLSKGADNVILPLINIEESSKQLAVGRLFYIL